MAFDPNQKIHQHADAAIATSPAPNDILVWDDAAAAQKWRNKPMSDYVALSTNGGSEAVSKVTPGTGSYTINLAQGNVHQITLNSDKTLSITGAINNKACSFTLYLIQGSGVTRNVTWPSSVKWAGGSAPSLSSGSGKVDVFVLESLTGNGGPWYASLVGKDFS